MIRNKVLITGSNGFLGSVITNEANYFFDVITLSRSSSDIICDLGNQVPHLPIVDSVIHVAGLAHVLNKAERMSHDFERININGANNLIKALNNNPPKVLFFISTVSVYQDETGIDIDEDYPIGSKSNYGKSKAFAEKIIVDWCKQNDVFFYVLRLPLVVGHNPKGNLKSMISSIKKGYYFNIEGGGVRRSMVLATDIAEFINFIQREVFIGRFTYSTCGFYNLTDGYHPSYFELSQAIGKIFVPHKKIWNLPKWTALVLLLPSFVLGKFYPFNYNRFKKLTNSLTFDDRKARDVLNWRPKDVLKNLNCLKS
jgi:nucleoside-diphosphate-sugar epimerase